MMKALCVSVFVLVAFGVFAGADEDAVKKVIVDSYKCGIAKDPGGMLKYFTDDAQVFSTSGQIVTKEQMKLIFGMMDALKNRNMKALMEYTLKMRGLEITPEIRQKIDSMTPEAEKQMLAQIEASSGGYEKMIQKMSDDAKKELATLKFESVTVKGNTAEAVTVSVGCNTGKLERNAYGFVRKDAKSAWKIRKQVTTMVKTAEPKTVGAE